MTSEAIRALDAIDPELGAFIEVDPDAVIAAARQAREGRLSGVLVAVKDLIDTAGLRTTYGSAIFADHVPQRNAAIIDTLESAGAIVLGKTNLHEFAHGVTGYNPHYGPTLIPQNRSRTAGGSSGGSAVAVASGVCDLAIGTDTSGSVRIPAACTGVYGMKLARGAAGMDGIFPLARSYDSVGFLAAGVEDLQRVMGIDELPDPQGLRIGRLRGTGSTGTGPDGLAQGIELEAPPLPAEHMILFQEQARGVHGERFERQREAYGRDLQWKLSAPLGDVEYARDVMAAWRAAFLETVAGVDVLVGLLLDGGAPTLQAAIADYENDDVVVGERLLRHTPLYNQLGWPALAVPTPDGPVQVGGPPGSEPAILAVGKAVGLHREETQVK